MKLAIVSFINMKGGVGKTTLCVNLAHTLSNMGYSVLVVDIDPQFNATVSFMDYKEYGVHKKRKKPTILNVFLADSGFSVPSLVSSDSDSEVKILPDDIILRIESNLHLIPGDLELIALEFIDRGGENILRNFILDNNLINIYNFIFIDCPPTHSLWTTSALIASDYYLIPVKPDFLSTLGLNLFITSIKKGIRKFRHKISSAGIVFTMATNTKHSKETIKEVKEDLKDEVYTNTIKFSTNIAKSPKEQKFIFNDEEHGKDMRDIAREFLKRVKINEI